MQKQRWAVVLAAGSGKRLQTITGRSDGASVPKQYCSMHGGPSLLRLALARAFTVVPFDRVLCVVSEEHELWWRRELAELPLENIIVQPLDRGTAVGTLLPVSVALDRDPTARLVFLPADHYVAGEQILSNHIARALRELEEDINRVVLLGLEPDEPDPELGYIQLLANSDETLGTVTRFVEKPSVRRAKTLIGAGALWNSFVFAAKAETLMQLFRRRIPRAVGAFQSAADSGNLTTSVLAKIYEQLDSADLSGDVFAGSEGSLAVLRVPSCGWTDLGTPERVARALESEAIRAAARALKPSVRPTHVNLSSASQNATSTQKN